MVLTFYKYFSRQLQAITWMGMVLMQASETQLKHSFPQLWTPSQCRYVEEYIRLSVVLREYLYIDMLKLITINTVSG